MPVSFAKYRRPPVSPGQHNEELVFQVADIDYSTDRPLEGYTPLEGIRSPVVRLFGMTKEGNSVTCVAHGFYPYLYIEPSRRVTPNECDQIRDALENILDGEITNQGRSDKYVISVEAVEKMTIKGYRETTSQYLKVTLVVPKHVPTAKRIVETGRLRVYGVPDLTFEKTTFESSLAFVTRFMTDLRINCAGWVRIANGKYGYTDRKISTAQIEVNAMYNDLVPFDAPLVAPWRQMFFDIECDAQPGTFCHALRDSVITFSASLLEYGQSIEQARKIRFQLRTCRTTASDGVDVYQFSSEKEMLMAIRDFIISYDPDLMLGWNILSFDFPYLMDRAVALRLQDFCQFSRVLGYAATARDDTFESKAYGKRNSKKISVSGRVPFDMMVSIMRSLKLRSYSLNAVSNYLLGETKIDLHHSKIHEYYEKDDDTRAKLGAYCDQDASLPMKIAKHQSSFINAIGMVQVTHVTMNMLLTQGQQVKVMAQLHYEANPEGYIIPTTPDDDKKHSTEGKNYEGAVVIEPERGFYPVPVATLDFASLYPSIMIAHNLSYDTLILRSDYKKFEHLDYEVSPHDDCRFVKTSVKEGVLTKILKKLLSERKAVRAEQKNVTDPLYYAVLESRQLALKVSANSVYGFTGAVVGKLPCIEISASVTGYGRQMIMATREYIMTHYTKANGYYGDAKVIYGDTDSVMVIFEVDRAMSDDDQILECMRLGIEACDRITATFPKPIKLEFEKVYSPYLLINKKRYAGRKWTKGKKGELVSILDVKGIETVRRDSCPLVKTTMDKALNTLIFEKDVEKAKLQCIEDIRKLFKGEVDMSQLVITKALSKEKDEYKGKQVHVEMVERMKARDPTFCPSLGDRVPYVMIMKDKADSKKNFEKSEYPGYVIENNIPVDYSWYLENQIRKPMERIFKYIVPDSEAIFSGEHTRYRNRLGEGEDPTKNSITNYFKAVTQCLNCRTTVRGGKKGQLCESCDSEETKVMIYHRETKKLRQAEQTHHALWSICGRCQADNGNKLSDVNSCGNMECPVFFARTKATKDLLQSKKRTADFMDW